MSMSHVVCHTYHAGSNTSGFYLIPGETHDITAASHITMTIVIGTAFFTVCDHFDQQSRQRLGKQGGDTRGSEIHHALRQSGSRAVKDMGVGWYQPSSP